MKKLSVLCLFMLIFSVQSKGQETNICDSQKKIYAPLDHYLQSSQITIEKQKKAIEFYQEKPAFLENIKELISLKDEKKWALINIESTEHAINMYQIALSRWGSDKDVAKEHKQLIAEQLKKKKAEEEKYKLASANFKRLNVYNLKDDFLETYDKYSYKIEFGIDRFSFKSNSDAIEKNRPSCLYDLSCNDLDQKLRDFKFASEQLKKDLDTSEVRDCLKESNEYSFMLDQFSADKVKADKELRKLSLYYFKNYDKKIHPESIDNWQMFWGNVDLTQQASAKAIRSQEKKLLDDNGKISLLEKRIPFYTEEYNMNMKLIFNRLTDEGTFKMEAFNKAFNPKSSDIGSSQNNYTLSDYDKFFDQNIIMKKEGMKPETWLQNAVKTVNDSDDFIDYMSKINSDFRAASFISKKDFFSEEVCRELSSKTKIVKRDLEAIRNLQLNLNSLKLGCANSLAGFRQFKKELNDDNRGKVQKLKQTFEQKIEKTFSETIKN
ncbi:MAG: hypothetical protein ACOYL6_16460 [Bacteriovoracaceae bacterium]